MVQESWMFKKKNENNKDSGLINHPFNSHVVIDRPILLWCPWARCWIPSAPGMLLILNRNTEQSWMTHTIFMVFTHKYSICTLFTCLTVPCDTAQYAVLWTFQFQLQLTSWPAASHVNLRKTFILWLWRLICLSLLSPLTVSLLSQHTHTHARTHARTHTRTHTHTHTLEERRHFVTWGR